MHLQSMSANSPNDVDSGGGGRTSNEQVHMYREMSSGALNRASYNKVAIQNYLFKNLLQEFSKHPPSGHGAAGVVSRNSSFYKIDGTNSK